MIFNLPIYDEFLTLLNQYEASAAHDADIVFFGDSLTQRGPWDALFPEYHTENRGIGGEHIFHAALRLDPIVALNPKVLFMLYGANDMYYCPVDYAAKAYEIVLRTLRRVLPDTRIFVESALPIRAETHLFMKPKLLEYNVLLEKLAAQHGAAFINLFPHFVDEEGLLRAEYTVDGVHLTQTAYDMWRDLLTPYLKEIFG